MREMLNVQAVVFLGTYKNKRIKGKWAIPVMGTVTKINNNGTIQFTATEPYVQKVDTGARDFWIDEVYSLEHYSKGEYITMDEYAKLPKLPDETNIPADVLSRLKNLEERVKVVEHKAHVVANNAFDNYSVASKIPDADL